MSRDVGILRQLKINALSCMCCASSMRSIDDVVAIWSDCLRGVCTKIKDYMEYVEQR